MLLLLLIRLYRRWALIPATKEALTWCLTHHVILTHWLRFWLRGLINRRLPIKYGLHILKAPIHLNSIKWCWLLLMSYSELLIIEMLEWFLRNGSLINCVATEIRILYLRNNIGLNSSHYTLLLVCEYSITRPCLSFLFHLVNRV